MIFPVNAIGINRNDNDLMIGYRYRVIVNMQFYERVVCEQYLLYTDETLASTVPAYKCTFYHPPVPMDGPPFSKPDPNWLELWLEEEELNDLTDMIVAHILPPTFGDESAEENDESGK